MFWFFFPAWAHPFDAKLYGHDIQFLLSRDSINVQYQLEVPLDVVQKELQEVLRQSPHVPLEDLREIYLQQRYEGLKDGLSLQIDGIDSSWDTSFRSSDKLKKENRFLIFQLSLTKTLGAGAHQISVWNRNHEDQVSMFRTSIEYQGGVWIDNSDLKQSGVWGKEEQMRETRICVRLLPHWWATLESLWFEFRNDERKTRFTYLGMETTERSFQQRLLRRELSFGEVLTLISLTLMLAFLYPFSNKRIGVGLILITLGCGMVLESWGDSKLWMTAILGCIGYRYPVLSGTLWLYLATPFWGVVCALPSVLCSKRAAYAWIWPFVLLLSFFLFMD